MQVTPSMKINTNLSFINYQSEYYYQMYITLFLVIVLLIFNDYKLKLMNLNNKALIYPDESLLVKLAILLLQNALIMTEIIIKLVLPDLELDPHILKKCYVLEKELNILLMN